MVVFPDLRHPRLSAAKLVGRSWFEKRFLKLFAASSLGISLWMLYLFSLLHVCGICGKLNLDRTRRTRPNRRLEIRDFAKVYQIRFIVPFRGPDTLVFRAKS